MSDYVTRAVEVTDTPALSRFRALIAGQPSRLARSRTPEFYEWKYFGSPVHQSRARIALDGSLLVGLAAVTYKRIKVGDATMLCAELGDLFTHPDFRRRGIFTRLTTEVCDQARADGARLIYVRPNDNSYPGLCKLGFQEIFRILPVKKLLDVHSLWREKRARGVAYRLAFPVASLVARRLFRDPPVAIPADLGVKRVEVFDEDVDTLWQDAAKDIRVAIVRDSRYLNWRYSTGPLVYTVHIARRAGSVVGYIVTKCEEDDQGRKHGLIVDMLWVRDRTIVAQTLLATALDHLREEQADVVAAWSVKAGPRHRVLTDFGFVERGEGFHFAIRNENTTPGERSALSDASQWYLTTGDTDGV
jgi:GNAT superfamily N-acetyltransferase